MRQIALKPQDIVVALKIALIGDGKRTFVTLARALALSASDVHNSTRRAEQAGIVAADRGDGLRVIKPALLEFLLHGVRYAFPAVFGGISQGMATAAAGPTLSGLLVASDSPTVWPYVHGKVRGPSIFPLYPSVPEAAAKDHELYDFLTLIDAIRIGAARDRELARDEIAKRLQ
jgi:DNA-binding Lrp family transcriptional regulator